MKSTITLKKRLEIFGSVLALLSASVLPALFSTQIASAAQITSRSVRLTSSVVGQTAVTYNISFNPATVTGLGSDDIKGIVVDFCQNSPLVGTSCVKTNGVTAVPVSGSVNVAHTGATGTPVSFTAQDPTGTANDGNQLVLTNITGLDVITAANPITFSFTATNPSGTSSTAAAPGTFYARVLTYNTEAGATSYSDTAPGTHLDDGGIALSTARQLTVNARVQEQLEFCVAALAGTIDTPAEVPANCAAFPSTTNVDIGVVDSSVASISPVAATSGGNETNGAAMIRTNAFGGATISYFAEQNTSSGRLKVAGVTCSGTTAFDAGSSEVDQCFNTSATQTSFAGTGEKFGMTIGTVLRPTAGTTTNLIESANYDGDGTAATGFAWQQSGANNPATSLASSTTVLDYEMLVLRYAARAAATTPTGAYAVTSTYIATSTF